MSDIVEYSKKPCLSYASYNSTVGSYTYVHLLLSIPAMALIAHVYILILYQENDIPYI